MSRIRNSLRFQSPEERILNGLLIVLLIVLGVVGVSKWRDGLAVEATDVRGIQVARSTPRSTSAWSSTSTTSVVPTSTTTVDPTIAFWYQLAQDRAARRSTTTTTTPPAGDTVPPPPATPPAVAPSTTTTRPNPTTTTSTSTSTTTTTTTTTAVTAPQGATPPVS